MKPFFKATPYIPYLFVMTLFTLVLSGCSTLPKQGSQPLIQQTPKKRIATLQQLHQWKITGKIAFIDTKSRNSATLSWQIDENQGTQQLNLTSYLGINVLQLDSTNNDHIIQVDGKTYHGQNLEALVQSITGLTLPTQALTFWLKGIPYQESDTISYQKITQLPQTLSSHYNNELWQVTYANYQQIEGYSLATKFSIKKDDLLIKIAVNEWSIN
ncbi:lipoprotein insertase outer membrane protein LolB [Colwellia sp. 12G3]|uniref:lipoprotein insertase outer membrane protein LolB n=1 Tax=Colwellia sp. 12G3 TaxID=2058299 RepID=UPI000C321C04|nr:lipoprotein insertase outer membrane protein LolB [Colwellia sp. 12G3]PKI16938.1 outer membrane lipoprotein LolB [Colwellia sp. 12G3]